MYIHVHLFLIHTYRPSTEPEPVADVPPPRIIYSVLIDKRKLRESQVASASASSSPAPVQNASSRREQSTGRRGRRDADTESCREESQRQKRPRGIAGSLRKDQDFPKNFRGKADWSKGKGRGGQSRKERDEDNSDSDSTSENDSQERPSRRRRPSPKETKKSRRRNSRDEKSGN